MRGLVHLPLGGRHGPGLIAMAFLLLALPEPAGCLRAAPLDAATVRQALLRSSAGFPFDPRLGYELTGRFVLRAEGEEFEFRARYARKGSHWSAVFEHADPRLGQSFGSGPQPWASSAEGHAHSKHLPFAAHYEFARLYAELLRILEQGPAGAGFRLQEEGGEIYVLGRLDNGLEVSFVFNATEYVLRKAAVRPGSPLPGWLFVLANPDGSAGVSALPENCCDGFEIWFSEPKEREGSRLPFRTDYMAGRRPVATFELEGWKAGDHVLHLDDRAPAEAQESTPDEEPAHPHLFAGASDLARLRAHAGSFPWSGWERSNALLAWWAIFVAWPARILPGPSSPLVLACLLILLPVACIVLLRRRARLSSRGISRRAYAVLALAWLLLLALGVAAVQDRTPESAALLAVQAALRGNLGGPDLSAHAARRLLLDALGDRRTRSMPEHARAARAAGLAYDLCAPALDAQVRAELREKLRRFARPLAEALRGRRFYGADGAEIAAGLGIAGMAVGCEPYVKAAEAAVEEQLARHFTRGLHRQGPGRGAEVLDALGDFAAALKRGGRRDYFADERFAAGAAATRELLSPSGLLPLYGSGLRSQSGDAASFLLKTAGRGPGLDTAIHAGAFRRFWEKGRCGGSRAAALMAALADPAAFLYRHPSLPLLSPNGAEPRDWTGTSSLLGDGQAVVLADSSGPAAVHLAAHALRRDSLAGEEDALAFELSCGDAVLLHGLGRPRNSRPEDSRTAAANTLLIQGHGQTSAENRGTSLALLNQPVFDQVRLVADGAWSSGGAQRDFILARAEDGAPAHIIVVDEVHPTESGAQVRWLLRGTGTLTSDIAGRWRWTSLAFGPSIWQGARQELLALPVGAPGVTSLAVEPMQTPGGWFRHNAACLVQTWTGPARFFTILIPRGESRASPETEVLAGGTAARIGAGGWFGLGDLETRRKFGPVRHIAEYTAVRESEGRFPALLAVGGLEISCGAHGVRSSKPVHFSLDGPAGTFLSTRPDTRVELFGPELREGDVFTLNGASTLRAGPELLVIDLPSPGLHRLARAAPHPHAFASVAH